MLSSHFPIVCSRCPNNISKAWPDPVSSASRHAAASLWMSTSLTVTVPLKAVLLRCDTPLTESLLGALRHCVSLVPW